MSKKCVRLALLKKLFGLVLALSCFCSVFLGSREVSALTWSYGTTTASGYYTGNSESSFTFNFGSGSRIANFSLPSGTRLTLLRFDFSSGTDFNSNVKPRLSGNQYYTISFMLGCNGAYLNSVGTVSYALPVITDIRASYSSDYSHEVVYGYNPNTGVFYYPGTTFDTEYQNYLVSVSGYIPTSENWDGILIFGGAILVSTANPALCSVGAPTLNLYDSESTQIQSSVDSQTAQQRQYHDEEQEGLDDAQSDASDGADSSGSQAESSGTTLLQAFIDFVNALNGASGSNCVINADIGDFRMGNVDLCSLSPPPAFQAISSIMVIGFTVPLSIALGKKMISLFRSFQT